jgi:hypothetical protein
MIPSATDVSNHHHVLAASGRIVVVGLLGAGAAIDSPTAAHRNLFTFIGRFFKIP